MIAQKKPRVGKAHIEREIVERHECDVCIVGAGPAGVVLAYLLARCGISVMLLEAQKDFDRQFRGDTMHAAIMEHMDQLGLAERLLQQPHYRIEKLSLRDSKSSGEGITFVDFSRLKTKYPFVTMMAQPVFLNFMAKEAQQYRNFSLLMGAAAQELIKEGETGTICGVRYQHRTEDSQRVYGEVHAALVVATDGRFSRLRKLAGLEPEPTAAPMDVLWFRLPKTTEDANHGMTGLMAGGRLPFILLEREDHWQCGLTVPHGGYQMLRKKGLEELQTLVAEAAPRLEERLKNHITDWGDVAWLTVTGGRLKQWWVPGMLLIGDAAHIMSPIGGVGINYAIQDAIVAANLLVEPLQNGNVTTDHLAMIQKEREWPTKVIQRFQSMAQKRILGPALQLDKPFVIPRFMRLLPHIPFLRNLPARLIGIGVRRVTVAPGILEQVPQSL